MKLTIAVSKNDACFKSGQKRLETNHHASLVTHSVEMPNRVLHQRGKRKFKPDVATLHKTKQRVFSLGSFEDGKCI